MRRTSLVVVLVVAFVAAGCATASLLADGRVLLLSGVAKIYDPATGRVTNAAQPPTLRIFGSATTLNDGRVLIAGGSNDLSSFSMGGLGGLSGAEPTPTPATATETTLGTAELYDPATDTYAPTGAMVHPRAFHTATLLADGRVLIMGGAGSLGGQGSLETGAPSPQAVPPPEIYDPATGTFSATSSDTLMPHAFHTATLLQDGKVLIAGGITVPQNAGVASPAPDGDSSGIPTTAAELFDPASGTSTATGSMTTPRIWGTATRLADGRVLFVGGAGTSDMSASSSGASTDTTPMTAEVYDPATGTFSPTGAPARPRMAHTANLLGDGHVLVAGGMDASSGQDPFLKAAELYDATSGTFAPTGDMVEGQAFHTGTTLQTGEVLLAGFGVGAMSGMMSGGSSGDLLSSAQLYDPETGTFSAVQVEPATMPVTSPG